MVVGDLLVVDLPRLPVEKPSKRHWRGYGEGYDGGYRGYGGGNGGYGGNGGGYSGGYGICDPGAMWSDSDKL